VGWQLKKHAIQAKNPQENTDPMLGVKTGLVQILVQPIRFLE
jgi:hypothetical protein